MGSYEVGLVTGALGIQMRRDRDYEQLPLQSQMHLRGFLAHRYSGRQWHSLVSLFLFNSCASSTKTTSTEYLSKPNTFISTKIGLRGSVQLDPDIPSHSHCLEQGPKTKGGHNKEEIDRK